MTGAPAVAQGLHVTVLGLAAAVLWGMSDFLGGVASRRASTLLVVVIAHGLSLVALVLVAALLHVPWPSERLAAWGLVTGISGGLALIAFYRAFAIGEMGLTAALAGVLTAMVPVVFSFFAEGRPKTTQMLGFALAAAAIWCIAYQPGGAPQRQGLGLAALAGLGFGGFLVASKFASQGAVLWPLAISRMASAGLALALLGAMYLRRHGDRTGRNRSDPADRRSPGAAGGVALVCLLAGGSGLLEATGNLLYMLATREGRLDVAAVLSSLYPVITILLAVWLLKERARPAQAWGMALAVAAVAVISL
jgi:drug/metabolite transporter (DMT)-like permease